MGNTSPNQTSKIEKNHDVQVSQLEFLYDKLLESQFKICDDFPASENFSETIAPLSIETLEFIPSLSSQLQKQTFLDLFQPCPEFALNFYDYIKKESKTRTVDKINFIHATKMLLGLIPESQNQLNSKDQISLLSRLLTIIRGADQDTSSGIISLSAVKQSLRRIFKLFNLLPYFTLPHSKLQTFVEKLTEQLILIKENKRFEGLKTRSSSDMNAQNIISDNQIKKTTPSFSYLKIENFTEEEFIELLIEYLPHLEESLFNALKCHLLFWKHPEYQKHPPSGLPLPNQTECLKSSFPLLWTHTKFFQSRLSNVEVLFNSNLDQYGFKKALCGYGGPALLLVKYIKEIVIFEEKVNGLEERGFAKYRVKSRRQKVAEIFGASVFIALEEENEKIFNKKESNLKYFNFKPKLKLAEVKSKDKGYVDTLDEDSSSKSDKKSGNLNLTLHKEKSFFYLNEQFRELKPSGEEFLKIEDHDSHLSLKIGLNNSDYFVIKESGLDCLISLEKFNKNSQESFEVIVTEVIATGTDEEIENWRKKQQKLRNLKKRVNILVKRKIL